MCPELGDSAHMWAYFLEPPPFLRMGPGESLVLQSADASLRLSVPSLQIWQHHCAFHKWLDAHFHQVSRYIAHPRVLPVCSGLGQEDGGRRWLATLPHLY